VSSYPGSGGSNLVDILDRVLDKGLVVAGDIRISLANVELLTIRIRLLVCSIDKAEQIGLNWWRYDQSLVRQPEAGTLPGGASEETVARLEARIAELEAELAARLRAVPAPPTASTPTSPTPTRGTRAAKTAGGSGAARGARSTRTSRDTP
jgi:hypothetical protein